MGDSVTVDFLKLLRVQWDRAAAAGCAVLGLIALVTGWFGVSGSVYPAEQLPYIVSGGLGGLLLVAAAATLWLSADLKDEWRHLEGLERRIEARIDERVAEAVAAALVGPASEPPAGTDGKPATRRRRKDAGAA